MIVNCVQEAHKRSFSAMSAKIIEKVWRAGPVILLLMTACAISPSPADSTTAPTIRASQSPQSQPTLKTTSTVSQIVPTERSTPVPLPTLPAAVGPALAYLKSGDIWMVDEPGSDPYPLTVAGDILSFAWAPNAERLIAFNGRTLCFFHRDGSVRTACLEIGLSDEQAQVERRLVLSPDQRWVVLWNPASPPPAGEISWIIVALDSTNTMYRIQDPVDWGAQLTDPVQPGGFAGKPVFLPDGRLVGAISHSSFCASKGCGYKLFEFDLQNRQFSPFNPSSESPPLPVSDGAALELSTDGLRLIDFGVLFEDCESHSTIVNMTDLNSETATKYLLEDENVTEMNFHPDLSQAILARSKGCRNPDLQTWAVQCKLASDQEVLTMQLWDIKSQQRDDLIPGTAPAWSPNGDWIVFESCLSQDESGIWQPDGASIPTLFLLKSSDQTITTIDQGMLAQWQP